VDAGRAAVVVQVQGGDGIVVNLTPCSGEPTLAALRVRQR
jgi:hypothetical protein